MGKFWKSKSGKRQAAAPVDASSDSDISFVSDDEVDWEAERSALRANLAAASAQATAAGAAADPFEHASLWAEVRRA